MNDLSFLKPESVGSALKRWRESKGWRIKDVVDHSRKLNPDKGFADGRAREFETGHGFSFETFFAEILPAYGIQDIQDLDLFLDFCRGHSLDDIEIVRRPGQIPHTNQGTEEILVNPDDLPRNRSRISIVKIKPGKCTKWQVHEGHEYVLVSKGPVKVEFAVNENDNRVPYELEQGQGIAFPSALFHSFINVGDQEAEITVARPTKSLPRGMGK